MEEGRAERRFLQRDPWRGGADTVTGKVLFLHRHLLPPRPGPCAEQRPVLLRAAVCFRPRLRGRRGSGGRRGRGRRGRGRAACRPLAATPADRTCSSGLFLNFRLSGFPSPAQCGPLRPASLRFPQSSVWPPRVPRTGGQPRCGVAHRERAPRPAKRARPERGWRSAAVCSGSPRAVLVLLWWVLGQACNFRGR